MFAITSDSSISTSFKSLGIQRFEDASHYIKQLPYRRNQDKNAPNVVLREKCGTCSTKHALLKRLAEENQYLDLKLMLGIFKMNSQNTPSITYMLQKNNLEFIPEAHSYLMLNGKRLDFTGLGMNEAALTESLLAEIEINPEQATKYKVDYHRDYLSKWIQTERLLYTVEELWLIREACIKEIAKSQCELSTVRLLLRPFRAEDAKMMVALNDDPEVLQYTGDVPFESDEAARTFLCNYDQYEKYSVGRLVVILKETNEILGWCGLKYHSHTDEYDIGYRFFKKYWGNGFATESARAAINYGFNVLKLTRIIGQARAENLASIKVFQKQDMDPVKRYIEDGNEWELYDIKADRAIG